MVHRYDSNFTDYLLGNQLCLLYTLTGSSIPIKELIKILKKLAKCPYGTVSDNAKNVLSQIASSSTVIEKVAYWWERPWGKWRTIPSPNFQEFNYLRDEYVPVLELADIRPWRGRYLICVSSKADKHSRMLPRASVRVNPFDRLIKLNPSEERFLWLEQREKVQTIEALVSELLEYARKNSKDWEPFAKGWQVVESLEELNDKIGQLVEINLF